jgi:ABC-type cobalamin/Fe3+-siderophores transport system ATPase subunit
VAVAILPQPNKRYLARQGRSFRAPAFLLSRPTYNPAVIELRSVGLRRGQRRLFEHLELSIPDPGIYGLVGPLASGKSLFGRMLCGLQRPSKGQVLVDQQNLYDMIRRRNIVTWYCAQAQLDAIDETVENYVRTMVFDSGGDQRHLREFLPRLERGVSIRRDQPLSELSSGELATLQIVLSGVMAARVVVMDGHADTLDHTSLTAALDLLTELRSEHETFLLLASHRTIDNGLLAGTLHFLGPPPFHPSWQDTAVEAEDELPLRQTARLRLKLLGTTVGKAFQSGQTYKVLSTEGSELVIERRGDFGAMVAELESTGLIIDSIGRA